MSETCEDCGKPLTDPVSRRQGRGPKCYRKKFGTTPRTRRPTITPKPRSAAPVEQVLTGFPVVDRDATLLCRATELVVRGGAASATALQRHLHIGYATAERLLAQLEDHGVVDHAVPRAVLVTRAHLEDTLARIREAL